ncbi:MAG: hypothetical protein K2W95_34730 [Candidatus Obscuribacterales bacterium]|nr:hypothetical protein [Candidatus Obscuribacterales bacterium]
MKGCFLINLEPPYIGFAEDGDICSVKPRVRLRGSCSEEIGSILTGLGVTLSKSWPLAECVAWIPCEMSDEELFVLKLK